MRQNYEKFGDLCSFRIHNNFIQFTEDTSPWTLCSLLGKDSWDCQISFAYAIIVRNDQETKKKSLFYMLKALLNPDQPIYSQSTIITSFS